MSDTCIYCGAELHKELYPASDLWDNSYMLKKCLTCAAVNLTPFPTAEMLALAYDETYYGCSGKKFKGPVERVLDFFRKGRARRVSRLLPTEGAILDIGCGNGQFLTSLLSFGQYRLYGAELPGKSAERAAQHKEIQLTTESVFDVPYPEASFDVISMFHVFEHLTEPQRMLHFVKRHMKPGGHFVVSFPNIESWQSRFFKGHWLHLDPPRHLFFFGSEAFIKIMNDNGFALKSAAYFSPEQNPYGFVQSTLNLMLKKREVLFEHLKGNTAYTSSYPSYSLTLQKIFFVFLFPFAVAGDLIAAVFKKGATVEFTFIKKRGCL